MNQFKTAIKIFLFMNVLTGLVYPLLITLAAQFIMPKKANGSLVLRGDQVIGSALIAQNTTNNRYFWPRPSATDYDPIKPSGGSNLGPTSQKLKDDIEKRKQKVGPNAPAELLYASGSGLDPHISLETAYYQIDRIAKARSMNAADLKKLVDSHAEGFGHKYVNVLLLNEALEG
jgi:potassium-transporting ATPase KdpC subunit